MGSSLSDPGFWNRAEHTLGSGCSGDNPVAGPVAIDFTARPAHHGPSGAASALEDILRERRITMAYQPVVDIEGGGVVGFEALARPRAASPGAQAPSILAVQHVAAARGVLADLDWICRTSALDDPGVSAAPAGITWFVNAEPRVLGTPCPPDLAGRPSYPAAGRTILEVTERAVADQPVHLLAGARAARSQGIGVAIDDVGVEPASLALLPILHPDVVKLDMGLLSYLSDPSVAQVAGAVRAYAERTGSLVLAEGIETAAQLQIARMLGAHLAQGFLFGHPGPLPATLPAPPRPIPIRTGRTPDARRTPYELLSTHREVGRATKEMLLPLTRHLEDTARSHDEPMALLTSFEDPMMFTPAVQARYRDLAARYAFVATFSRSLPDGLPRTVRAGQLPENDPLRLEWDLVVIGPYFCAALTARDVGERLPDLQRRFDYVLTHDRSLVEQAARIMTARLGREQAP